MASSALILGERELRPLVDTVGLMDSAIDAIERTTLDFHRGKVREQNLVDQRESEGPSNLLQIHFAANDEVITGFQVFAESRGGPHVPNSRFITLLDNRTRQLLAIVDYALLNPLRVGASAGVGCRYLASTEARTVAILGSSKQARAQLQAIQRSVRTVERVRVFSPTAEHRETFAKEVSEWLDLPVEAVESARDAVADADIVGLANNSRQPVLQTGDLKPGALVISIGSGQLPTDVAHGPRVVATTWESLATREPYAAEIKAGRFSQADVAADLGALIAGEAPPVRQAPTDTVVFELTRINAWAVSIAHWAYLRALDSGIGLEFALSDR